MFILGLYLGPQAFVLAETACREVKKGLMVIFSVEVHLLRFTGTLILSKGLDK